MHSSIAEATSNGSQVAAVTGTDCLGVLTTMTEEQAVRPNGPWPMAPGTRDAKRRLLPWRWLPSSVADHGARAHDHGSLNGGRLRD